ncbi:MAG: hypothetical protein IJS74_00575 [Clostridia bacterium]|nr:hypothetical protein [Clostridia bacterium]
MYKTCSCFGHLKIEITENLKENLYHIIENFILNENVRIFLFGGFGMFDDLCHQIVTTLKTKFPDIKRVYVLEDEKWLDDYKRPKYLSTDDYESFEYYQPRYIGFYKRIYFRNLEIIDRSDFVIFYIRNTEKSGAYKAYKYAVKCKKKIISI